MSEPCFHCGLPVLPDADFPIRYRNRPERTCCAGCQAVAKTIIESGLGDYYEHRTEGVAPVEALPLELLEQIRLYDAPEVQASFVHIESEHVREAALILEGITCAACVWLNEQHIKQLAGVISVDIHYTSHRARVRWDNSVIQLSAILEAICAIGYRAHPYDAERQEKLAQKERKTALTRLWVAGLSMMQVMMYAVPVYLANDGEIDRQSLWLLHWASFLLTLPVVLYSALPFYRATWRDLKLGRVGMDTPVSIGILTAFIASSYALINQIEHGIYFDSVSMFVFLLLGGRYLESLARRKAGAAAEGLIKLIPAFIQRLPDWPHASTPKVVTVASLIVGDVILVKPGETLPADARVVAGHSAVNESLLTGESRPVEKTIGDQVIAGAVNTSSPLTVQVERTGTDTRLAGIVRLLDRALSEKPRLAEIADRFAAWFVSGLLVAAVMTLIAWQWIDSDRALWVMVAVLVISCPCALSLATPAALTAASGRLAGLGVLIARGHALESLAKITDVVFDKTGTLTHGDMRVLGQHYFAAAEPVKAAIRTLEQGSEHPLAKSLLAELGDGAQLGLHDLRNVPGCGVEAFDAEGQCWRIGRPAFVAEQAGECPALPADWYANASRVGVACDGQWLAMYALGDSVREESAALVQALHAQGLRTHLLSGDRQAAVAATAQQLAIQAHCGDASPEQKLDYVSQLQAEGRCILMVGDGINDAPVLARANVSLAMGSGTDVARLSADMVLVNEQLLQIPAAIRMGQRTLTIIHQNLWWAAGYNLLALPLAMSGHVTPWLASLGMALSSLLVVSNALRLTK